MENYELLLEDFDDVFAEVTESFLAEAYTEPKAKKALAKLKAAFPYKVLSAEWDKSDMIKASGQDVSAVKAYRKGYDKAVKDFSNLVSPRNLTDENLKSFFTKESVKKAEKAAAAVKKLYPGVMKIEAKFAKGRKAAGKMKAGKEVSAAKEKQARIAGIKKSNEVISKQMKSAKVYNEKMRVKDNKDTIKKDNKARRKAFAGRVRQKVAKINFKQM